MGAVIGFGSFKSGVLMCICLFDFVFAVFYIYMWYQVYIFSRQLDLDGRTSLEGILQNVTTARP